jgi:hypothetical protein
LSIEQDGRFLGQNVNGCQSTGQVAVIDARYNVYAWDATLVNCCREWHVLRSRRARGRRRIGGRERR